MSELLSICQASSAGTGAPSPLKPPKAVSTSWMTPSSETSPTT